MVGLCAIRISPQKRRKTIRLGKPKYIQLESTGCVENSRNWIYRCWIRTLHGQGERDYREMYGEVLGIISGVQFPLRLTNDNRANSLYEIQLYQFHILQERI